MALIDGGRVLVTGAEGFIGSHLVERLLERGAEVRAMVLYNSFGSWGWLDTLPRDKAAAVEVVTGDVRDPQTVKEAMRGCDVVLHLAALIAIPYSYAAPQSYIDTNITGTTNVLQAARELGTARVVHTSTSEVYGSAQYVPIDENHPLVGQSPYSASKIAADQMAVAFHRSFGVPVAIIRPFNTYGPRQSARAVIPTIISQIAAGADHVELGALTPTRDFTFVADTADAFITVAEADQAVGQVTNIGSGFEISVAETARLIAEVMGKPDIPVRTAAARMRPRDSEVDRLFCDYGKARRALGWEPRFGGRDGMRRGLEATVAWFSDPANLRLYKSSRYNV